MATISKFYLHDAASPVAGTLPATSPAAISGATVTGDATGAATPRLANDIIGVANPDTKDTVTALANATLQTWGHRRYVSAPLAAHAFTAAEGNWTFSFAVTQSNTNHNATIKVIVYMWDPVLGVRVGSGTQFVSITPTTFTGTTQTAKTGTAALGASVTTTDGNVLIFDVYTTFTQGMSVAYTENFSYDGTVEASTTTCASFVTPPVALTLQAPPPSFGEGHELRGDPKSLQVLGQAVKRSAYYCLGEKWAKRGKLWIPAADRPYAVAV